MRSIHEWGKKVVVVLNKADLLDPAKGHGAAEDDMAEVLPSPRHEYGDRNSALAEIYLYISGIEWPC
jgi:hypothetical protein|eukprot:SAG25_NODE_119_length_14756_cov_696.499898_8_plen_67_part_00